MIRRRRWSWCSKVTRKTRRATHRPQVRYLRMCVYMSICCRSLPNNHWHTHNNTNTTTTTTTTTAAAAAATAAAAAAAAATTTTSSSTTTTTSTSTTTNYYCYTYTDTGRRLSRCSKATRLTPRETHRPQVLFTQTVHIQRAHEHTRRRNWSEGGLERASGWTVASCA